MPDHNPDREGHRTYKYLVHRATKDKSVAGVRTSKGFLKFNKQGRCVVSDKTLANEIRQSPIAQRDVCVSRVVSTAPADQGHTYFFGAMPPMPWHPCPECGLPNHECRGNHGAERRETETDAEAVGDANG